jgi:hypothetical protein
MLSAPEASSSRASPAADSPPWLCTPMTTASTASSAGSPSTRVRVGMALDAVTRLLRFGWPTATLRGQAVMVRPPMLTTA